MEMERRIKRIIRDKVGRVEKEMLPGKYFIIVKYLIIRLLRIRITSILYERENLIRI